MGPGDLVINWFWKLLTKKKHIYIFKVIIISKKTYYVIFIGSLDLPHPQRHAVHPRPLLPGQKIFIFYYYIIYFIVLYNPCSVKYICISCRRCLQQKAGHCHKCYKILHFFILYVQAVVTHFI